MRKRKTKWSKLLSKVNIPLLPKISTIAFDYTPPPNQVAFTVSGLVNSDQVYIRKQEDQKK